MAAKWSKNDVMEDFQSKLLIPQTFIKNFVPPNVNSYSFDAMQKLEHRYFLNLYSH